MLPKELRLGRGFSVIFQKGAKIQTPFFVLRALPTWDEMPRLAVSVSRKSEKTAVRRNRIRRRLISAVKTAGFPQVPVLPCRIVIIGFSTTLEAPFPELCTAFKNAFLRLENWRFPNGTKHREQGTGNINHEVGSTNQESKTKNQ